LNQELLHSLNWYRKTLLILEPNVL
jgi:hypothetical protein